MWYKAYNTPGGWLVLRHYESDEIVTDIDGRFMIQSKQTWTLPVQRQQRGANSYIFKSAYGPLQFQAMIYRVKTR